MFKWAIERGIVTANPAADLTPPAPPVRRDRVLSQAELGAVLKAADRLHYPWRHFYLLLILTAARRDEVAGMRWAELDLEKRPLDDPRRAHEERTSPRPRTAPDGRQPAPEHS